MTATVYVPVGWLTTTPRSARNMDHLETMYADLKSSIDLHTHPNIHYSESQSNARFFGSGLESGLDAKYIDSKTLAQIMGGLSPIGLHLLWKGTDNDFSNGYLIQDSDWHLADGGTYSGTYTKDMRGYFPRSALTSSGSGTGGVSTITPTGNVTIGNHTLSVAEMATHYHEYDDYYMNTYGTVAYGDGLAFKQAATTRITTGTAGSGNPHDHDTKGISLSTIDKNPLFKSLYFIAKVT